MDSKRLFFLTFFKNDIKGLPEDKETSKALIILRELFLSTILPVTVMVSGIRRDIQRKNNRVILNVFILFSSASII